MSFFYRTVAASLFPSILWHTNAPTVHLTFDDGPHASATPRVLEILKIRHLKATFFLLGENVDRYPDLVREINDQGHFVGNHSLTHSSLLLKPSSWQSRQMKDTNEIIQKTIGKTPGLFRPPFGHFDLRTIKTASSHGLKTVMWDVDSKDYSASDIKSIIRRVCRQTGPGSIVLFHDNDSTSARIPEYLNPILDNLEQRNLSFAPLIL
ncbi:MAG: polysaccharide deacetylase family protein [Ignavibacteriales bacterium]|nr:polysaccharide deacetylase family protein [Ignavibacteriales bacterium]